MLELSGKIAGASVDAVAEHLLEMATELAVHGHHRTAMIVAESILARLELETNMAGDRASSIAWANRLLGRTEQERNALEQITRSDADTLTD